MVMRLLAPAIILAAALLAAGSGGGRAQPIEEFPHVDPGANTPKPPDPGVLAIAPPELMHVPPASDGRGPVSAEVRNDQDALSHIGGPLTFSMGQWPVFDVVPAISGQAVVGERLFLEPLRVSFQGALHGDPPEPRYEFQWQRYSTNGVGTDIYGAHDDSYRLEQADFGLLVRCQAVVVFGDRRIYADSQLTDVVR